MNPATIFPSDFLGLAALCVAVSILFVLVLQVLDYPPILIPGTGFIIAPGFLLIVLVFIELILLIIRFGLHK